MKKLLKMILLLAIPLIVFTGCSDEPDEKYNTAIENGLDSLIMEDYERAEAYFENATEDNTENKASRLLKQVQLFMEANTLIDDTDFNGAIEKAEEASEIEDASYALTKKSHELISDIKGIEENINQFTEELGNANSLIDEGSLEDASLLLEDLLNNEMMNETYYTIIKEDGEELKQEIGKKQAEAMKEKEEQELAEAEEKVKAEEERKKNEVNNGATDFDNLPLPIRVHLATTLVDERADDLEGFYLSYNIKGDKLFVRISSGAGVGHPVYKIQIDSDTITPIDGVSSISYDEIAEIEVNSSTISKADLYQYYLENKNIFNSGQDHIEQDSTYTTEMYETMQAELQ